MHRGQPVRILAIDTATENCSAALLIDGRVLERARLLDRGHAEHILPMIDELLGEAAVKLRELSAIAFGRGPGAFTGVRLAASVTQGLAFGGRVPVVPISDLRAVAQRVLQGDSRVARVLVCADARMREVYWGCFERSSAGLALAIGAERVDGPAEVQRPQAWCGRGEAEGEPEPASGMLVAAGSGFATYPALGASIARWAARIAPEVLPRALEIGILAVPEVEAGRILPAEQALPLYLRDDVTQTPHAQSLN